MTDISKLSPHERLALYKKRRRELEVLASNEGWLGTEEFDKREQELFEEIMHKGKKS